MTYIRKNIGKHFIISLTDEDLQIAIPMMISTIIMLSAALIAF